MCASMMEYSFTTNSGIGGYHIYKDGKDAPIGLLWTRNWKQYWYLYIGSEKSYPWRHLIDIILFRVKQDHHKFISNK